MSIKTCLCSIFLAGLLASTFLGCIGNRTTTIEEPGESYEAREIYVSVTPREVSPGGKVYLTIDAPGKTYVIVTIENKNSGYRVTVYEGLTEEDGTLELSIGISKENIEKKLGENIIVVYAPNIGGEGYASFFVVQGDKEAFGEVDIKVGDWNPDPSALEALQRELVELAYLFAEAEIVTNSLIHLDPEKTPYEEFQKRLLASIFLWEAVENKSKDLLKIAKSLESSGLSMPAPSNLPGPRAVHFQIAGGTLDIQAYTRAKEIAEFVERFAPKVGESAAKRRAGIMMMYKHIADAESYNAKFYDVAYKTALTLEVAGKIAEGVIGMYSGYTGLLKAKTVGEQAFRLTNLVLTKFAVVYSLTKEGAKIYYGGVLSDEAYAVFAPGDYTGEVLGIIGLTTGSYRDPDNIIYIAGKIGSAVSYMLSEDEILEFKIDASRNKLIIRPTKLPMNSPWAPGKPIFFEGLFIPGYYKLPSGEEIYIRSLSPRIARALKELPEEYVLLTSSGEIKIKITERKEKEWKFSGVHGLRELSINLKPSSDCWIKATLSVNPKFPAIIRLEDIRPHNGTHVTLSERFLNKIKLEFTLKTEGSFKPEFSLSVAAPYGWGYYEPPMVISNKEATIKKTLGWKYAGNKFCEERAEVRGNSLIVKCSVELQAKCYNKFMFVMCGDKKDRVEFEVIYEG